MINYILIIILQLSNVFSIPPLVEHEFLKKTIEDSKTVSIENVKTKVSVTKVFVTLWQKGVTDIGKRGVSEDGTN